MRAPSQAPALLGANPVIGSDHLQAHRHVPGKLLPRSIQFGVTVAPRLPHRMHRPCRPNDDTRTSSGQASTLTAVLLPQARQVAKNERTPRLRMLPSVIGRIGSSERGIERVERRVICVRIAGSMARSRNCKAKLGRAAVRRQPRRCLFFNPALRCLLRDEARNMNPPAIEPSYSDIPFGR
jgi:hypothetical protein